MAILPQNLQTDKQQEKMKYIIKTFLLLTITSQFVFAQEKLPILKTNKTIISIKEGNSDYKDSWTIAPEVKPDVFVTQKFTGTQIITFYSDIDTISFTVKPNKKYDFIILLNGKDKSYTQISTDSKQNPSLEPKLFYTRLKNTNQVTDTIPFTLGKDNYIHLKGKINNSDTVDFLFDTGASSCVITSSLIASKFLVLIPLLVLIVFACIGSQHHTTFKASFCTDLIKLGKYVLIFSDPILVISTILPGILYGFNMVIKFINSSLLILCEILIPIGLLIPLKNSI